jgi:hypothetical protein
VRYDPRRGAAHYLTKSLLDGSGGDYGMSSRMPRFRKESAA